MTFQQYLKEFTENMDKHNVFKQSFLDWLEDPYFRDFQNWKEIEQFIVFRKADSVQLLFIKNLYNAWKEKHG